MGVSHKIYKQEGLFKFREAYTQLESILSFCSNGSIMLNARPNRITAVYEIFQKHRNSIKEVEFQITSKQNDKIDNLILSNDTFKFCFIRTPDYHKEDIFGIQLTINYGYKKVNLQIDLPYSNCQNSKDEFVSFIEEINEELCLGFRNKDQIEKEIGQLVQLHFDKEFYDSSWKLHFGSNIYSSAGAAKEVFENNTTKKFRSTGFRIKFPDNKEHLRTFTEYAKLILLPSVDYFQGKELDFHFFSDNSNLIDKIIQIDPNKVKSEIIIDLTENIKNGDKINPELYQGDGQVNFRIEELKPDELDEYFFTLEYYGNNLNELEFILQIDKNASEEYVEKVLNLFESKPKYSHLE